MSFKRPATAWNIRRKPVHSGAMLSSITVLGHSLGGALATLTAGQIAFANPAIGAALSLWTYASPTIGFLDFTSAFNKAVPSTYRVWNSLDIVPQLPPFPYLHVGQSEKIKQTPTQIQLNPTDFKIGVGLAVVNVREVGAMALAQALQ